MEKSVVRIGESYKNVLQAINEKPTGIAFVVNSERTLVGLLTDGDLRRKLLNGLDLNSSVQLQHLNKNYVFARQGDDIPSLLRKSNQRIRIVPIVDPQGKLVDYFQFEAKTNLVTIAEPSLRSEELANIIDAYLSTWISNKGKYIDQFENDFSHFCEMKHGIATNNGTSALHLALLALDIGRGDEVIIPDFTFAATINAVLHVGATPVIVDVDMERWTISPQAIEEAITSKTKAVIPVHIYGQPADMTSILAIARKHSIFVIEDAAEAHGAEFEGHKVGSFGDISCFSFYANKIITTGEGGMCLCNDSSLDRKLRLLRDHGMDPDRKYWHIEVGHNFRMTNIQAAIGCAQFDRINEIIQMRLENENHLKDLLGNSHIEWQTEFTNSKKVTWLICGLSRSVSREHMMEIFKNKGIETRPFFHPLSAMPIYKEYAGKSPNTEILSKTGLSFPAWKQLDSYALDQVKKILTDS